MPLCLRISFYKQLFPVLSGQLGLQARSRRRIRQTVLRFRIFDEWAISNSEPQTASLNPEEEEP